jgi:phosphate transport system substrate-binding protein
MKAAAIFLLGAYAALAAPESKKSAEPENSGRSIWTQNVTGFRKEHGAVGGYKRDWGLGDLPHYVPKQKLTGKLRLAGSNYLKDGDLGGYWREEFRKFQPGLTLEFFLPTQAVAIPALACGTADIGITNRATLVDLLMFEQVYHHPISEVTWATGSFDVYGWSPATIFAVHKDNPLTQITWKQLDGVFGGARYGGYAGSVWHTEYPYSRGPEENIRTWGQLGLTGEWADKPIHVGGQNLKAGVTSFLNDKLLRGSSQFVEGYRTFTNYIMPDGKVNSWSQQARRAIEQDKYALFYLSPAALGPGWRPLAVQGEQGGPFVVRSLETVHDRSYPFVMDLNFYFDRAPGQPLDPKIEEFLRFVLSQDGQACIQREGRYLPLTAGFVREQLQKLQ